jgi:hypothetical protein
MGHCRPSGGLIGRHFADDQVMPFDFQRILKNAGLSWQTCSRSMHIDTEA